MELVSTSSDRFPSFQTELSSPNLTHKGYEREEYTLIDSRSRSIVRSIDLLPLLPPIILVIILFAVFPSFALMTKGKRFHSRLRQIPSLERLKD